MPWKTQARRQRRRPWVLTAPIQPGPAAAGRSVLPSSSLVLSPSAGHLLGLSAYVFLWPPAPICFHLQILPSELWTTDSLRMAGPVISNLGSHSRLWGFFAI